MADDTIAVQQSSSPTHQVDGKTVVNDAAVPVFRQTVGTPDALDMLSDIRQLLAILAGVAPARDPATHSAKVQVQGTVPVSGSLTTAGTVSTVTTLTTMANQTNFGGFPAQNQQFGHGAEASAFLVQRAVSG